MDYKDLTLILPTLNERDALPLVLRQVLKSYKGISILVVDDGSMDGTQGIAARFGRNGKVRLLDRRRMGSAPGLTASIIDGIKESRTRFVVVMDADLQHPPEKIARIKALLEEGYILVVAVRKKVSDWPMHRKIVSNTLSGIGHIVLTINGKKGGRDIFSGFFGADRKAVLKIISANRKRFVGEGYKVLFDLLKCMDPKGDFRITEIGYEFGGRHHGKSKAGVKQAVALLKSFLT